MSNQTDNSTVSDPNQPKLKVMNLKRQLKLYLEHRGLSAAELSRQSKVSKQVISQWLSGVSPKKIQQVKDVAAVLNTTIDELCFSEGINREERQTSALEGLLSGDAWVGGTFEIKLRRVAKK